MERHRVLMIIFKKVEGVVEVHGDNAKSVVYWKPSECPARKELKTTRDTELMAVRRYLENSSDCRRKRLLAYFDPNCAQSGKEPSRCCDVCLTDFI